MRIFLVALLVIGSVSGGFAKAQERGSPAEQIGCLFMYQVSLQFARDTLKKHVTITKQMNKKLIGLATAKRTPEGTKAFSSGVKRLVKAQVKVLEGIVGLMNDTLVSCKDVLKSPAG